MSGRHWALRPPRYSGGAEQQMGGRATDPPHLWAKLAPSGRSPTCVGASAYIPLGWSGAAEGRACGRAKPGPCRDPTCGRLSQFTTLPVQRKWRALSSRETKTWSCRTVSS